MRCFFCDKPAKGVTRVTDPILLAQLKRLAHNILIVEQEHLVCADHYAVLTGRAPAKLEDYNGQK